MLKEKAEPLKVRKEEQPITDNRVVDALEKVADRLDGKKPAPDVTVIPDKITYMRVEFPPVSSENEEKTVIIGIKGNLLHIRRGEPVVIPSNYWQANEDAKYVVFSRDESSGFRPVGVQQWYPCRVIDKDVPVSEYKKMLQEGKLVQSQARKREREKMGM